MVCPAGPRLPTHTASRLTATIPDLFSNTKRDLGPCPKVHNEALKAEYDAASEEQRLKWGFDFDVLRAYGREVSMCDSDIHRNEDRLDKTADEARRERELAEQITTLTEQYETAMAEIRFFATKMDVVHQAVLDHVAARQKLHDILDARQQLAALNEQSGPSGHQKLQVCDTCAAYLSRLDNDRRLADHFSGKLHLGFAHMRKHLVALKEATRGRAQPQRDTEMVDDMHGGYGGGYGGRGGGGGYGRRGGGGGGFRGGRGGRGGGGGWGRGY